jgi:hypothetical protein
MHGVNNIKLKNTADLNNNNNNNNNKVCFYLTKNTLRLYYKDQNT